MNQHTYKVGSPHRINRFSCDFLELSHSPHEKSQKSHSPSPSTSTKNRTYGRFIPTKLSNELYQMFLHDFQDDPPSKVSRTKTYSNLLVKSMTNIETSTNNPNKNLLKFNEFTKLSPIEDPFLAKSAESEKLSRKISPNPYKKLETPHLRDDFYLNVLDWSCTNEIALGLDNKLHIWSPFSNKSQLFSQCSIPDVYICSVSFNATGQYLAIGDSLGEIAIYDTNKEKLLIKIAAHKQRIGSLAWNGALLASGSRDKQIHIRDTRSATISQEPLSRITSHKQEICGLRWSFDEKYLASGGNDNRVNVWSLTSRNELCRFTGHSAAVKAIAWSPHQFNTLVSGGGTSDKTIRMWNTHNLQEIGCVDSGSQVCNILFAKNVEEIVSTHGFSLNQINVWRAKDMRKIACLSGHSMRVLYLAASPCGENIVTGAGDETLMFWNVFPAKNKNFMELVEKKTDLR